MLNLSQHLLRLSEELGLRIELSPRIDFGTGGLIEAVALFPDLGDAQGMLVFADFGKVRGISSAISDRGYGIATLTDPHREHEDDKRSFIEMIRDWGWTGSEESRPLWFDED